MKEKYYTHKKQQHSIFKFVATASCFFGAKTRLTYTCIGCMCICKCLHMYVLCAWQQFIVDLRLPVMFNRIPHFVNICGHKSIRPFGGQKTNDHPIKCISCTINKLPGWQQTSTNVSNKSVKY